MSDRPSATDMQPTLCSVAKRMASEHFGIRLDLSARSVRHVEKILGAIHKEHLKSRSAAAFDGIALEYAAYIVEVVQGHFGPAHWRRDCPREGIDTFPLYWRNQVLYPYDWCQKRIYAGATEDVWSRFSDAVLGKPARRWWQPFGRRATDAASPSSPQRPETPGRENRGAGGHDGDHRPRGLREDRRALPVRQEASQPPAHRAPEHVAVDDQQLPAMSEGVGRFDAQTPEELEVSDVLGVDPPGLAGGASDAADDSPRRRSGSGTG